MFAGSILLPACAAPRAAARIMTFEEYRAISHAVPYVLEVQDGNGGELIYFGARHSYEPDDPQCRWIEQLWTDFRPAIAFNEGGDPPALSSAAEAISHHGEAGLVRFLAARDGVPVKSLEPTLDQLVDDALAAGFSPQQVKLYHALLPWISYRQSAGAEPLEAFMGRVLSSLSQFQSLQGPPRDVRELDSVFAELFPEQPDWRSVPREWFDPAANGTFLNALARRVSELRDVHMVGLLSDAVRRGERVFAVVGASHVVMQEPALTSAHDRARAWTVSHVSARGGIATQPAPRGD